MSSQIQDLPRCTRPWLGRAVLKLDRSLCRSQGIYEYTQNAACVFRVERARADQTVELSDGTHVEQDDPVLKLHLWNEHVPSMARRGATIAWASRLLRALDISLEELARYVESLMERPEIPAICADMRLGRAEENECLRRILGRYGFEAHPSPEAGYGGALHRFGETVLICMLVLATNPITLRFSTLRRDYVRVYLSRRALERRYGRGNSRAIGEFKDLLV